MTATGRKLPLRCGRARWPEWGGFVHRPSHLTLSLGQGLPPVRFPRWFPRAPRLVASGAARRKSKHGWVARAQPSLDVETPMGVAFTQRAGTWHQAYVYGAKKSPPQG